MANTHEAARTQEAAERKGRQGAASAVPQAGVAGSFTLPGTALEVRRMGYGAMQLAGADGDKRVWGPPRDIDAAIRVLQDAVASGVNHVDTADFYGPRVTNQIIRRALAPYPNDLLLATKVGARRGEDGSWIHALSRDELTQQVHDNLRNLGLEVLDLVNLRVGGIAEPVEGSIAEPLAVLAGLQRDGLIRHLGVSNVTPAQIDEARRIAPIVCVQNHYNLAHRGDDALVADLARDGIAYVPYFPLGGFAPLQSEILSRVAARLAVAPMQVALAWLLQRSPNILVIPGTSSPGHLRENLQAASLRIPVGALAELDALAQPGADAVAARQ